MATVEHTASGTYGRMPLGRRIAELMQEKGDNYSIRAFAPQIGLSREYLRLLLAGERPFSPSIIEKIAQGLGVTVERLKQMDSLKKEQELDSLLKSNKRTKPMMMRAEKLANELVELAKGITEKGYSLYNLGRVQYFQQKYEEAHQTWNFTLENAKQIYEQYNDTLLFHLVSTNLMLTFTIRKEFSNIEEFLVVVEKVFSNDPDKLGIAQYTRMKVQEERGNIELAKQHAYKCLEYFVQTDSLEQESKAMVNIAHYEYLLGNYQTSSRILAETIDKSRPFVYVLVHAVKEYVKSLIQLRDYDNAARVIEEYESIAKEYPDYWGKLQIMYTTAKGDPSFAENVTKASDISLNIRYIACKSLMEFYYLKGDYETSIRYYEKSRIYSNKKSEYLSEGGF